MGHYYAKALYGQPEDEATYLSYKAVRDSYDDHPLDIDLRISLKTGMAWRTYKENEAKPVTSEQINTMISYLNTCIKKIKKSIISHMIVKSDEA